MKIFPVREITNKKSRKKTGLFPSQKIGRTVAFESLLERDYIHLLEFDKEVISYVEQPLSIEYIENQKKLKYTPDFMVIRKAVTQIVEVKPKAVLEKIMKDEKKSNKFLAAHYYCKQNNYEFKIVTDENIRQGNTLKNIKMLFMFARVSIPMSEKSRILERLDISGPIQIEQLLKTLSTSKNDYAIYKQYIFSMIYNKQIYTDINKLLDKNELVWI